MTNSHRALAAPSDPLMQSPSLYLKNRRLALNTCVLCLCLPPIAIFTTRPADYLSVHILLEMFAISVSSIAWNTPD